jgi:transposase
MGKHHTEDYKLSAVKYALRTGNQVHKHYSLLVAISNKKTIGWTLYEKGAVNAERLVEFIRKFINGHYTGYTVVMDNAMFHKSNTVKDAVKEGGNEVLYSVPYYPRSNPIEQFFSQMKHYIKKESPILFDDIKRVVASSIEKVKPKNYENYFLHAFRAEWLKKDRKTRKRPIRIYKI